LNVFFLFCPFSFSRSIDEDEDNYNNLNGPLIFVNSALNLSIDSSTPPTHSDRSVQIKSRLSERSENDVHNHRKVMNNHIQPHQLNPRCSTSYTRLPHSLRKKPPPFNSASQSGAIRPPLTVNPPIRRQFPQFESVRTPVQKSPTTKQESPSTIPSEMFDCCQTYVLLKFFLLNSSNIEYFSESVPLTTERRSNHRQATSIEKGLNESETRSNYFRDTSKIREIMINVSKRLTSENDSIPGLPLVDTHCHFDLIFDR
jgi:hypothetical protein